MTCVESQDLLLDLAYGELEPARATQVEEHVASCAACRAEKSQLDEARKLASPLRALEDPPPEFDEPILRAARAEAGMQADGTPGPVVEVAASVKPLGLQAARLDPHAKVRKNAGRAPWRSRRAAVFASVAAAAAAVAVAVSLSLPSSERGRDARQEVAPIRAYARDVVVPDTSKDALARNDQGEPAAVPPGASSFVGSRTGPSAAPERKAAAPPQDTAAPKALAKLARREDQVGSAKGTASSGAATPRDGKTTIAERSRAEAMKQPPPPPENRASPISAAQHPSYDRSQPDAQSAAPAVARTDVDRAPAPRTPAAGPDAAPAAPVSGGVVAMAAQTKNEDAPPPAKKAQVRTADALEDDAGAARRAGDYARAAALYREAAAMRKESVPQRAAWDMAHAVECLAAGGNVAEAVAVRSELLQSFPEQQGPRAAANSALRFVPLPNDENAPAGK